MDAGGRATPGAVAEAAPRHAAAQGRASVAGAGGAGATAALDSRDLHTQLSDHQALTQALAATAQTHHARLPGEPAAAQLPVITALTDTCNSLQAQHTVSGQGGGCGTATAYDQPLLALSAPGGIAALTPQNTVLSVGHTTHLSAPDLNLLAQGHYAVTVKDGISLFTHGQASNSQKPTQDTGIKLHAAQGNVSAQAQSAPLTVAADQNITLASTTQSATLTGKTHVLLTAGGGYIKLAGGNIEIGAPGGATFLGGQHVFGPPASVSVAGVSLPKASALKGCDLKGKSSAAAGDAFSEF